MLSIEPLSNNSISLADLILRFFFLIGADIITNTHWHAMHTHTHTHTRKHNNKKQFTSIEIVYSQIANNKKQRREKKHFVMTKSKASEKKTNSETYIILPI